MLGIEHLARDENVDSLQKIEGGLDLGNFLSSTRAKHVIVISAMKKSLKKNVVERGLVAAYKEKLGHCCPQLTSSSLSFVIVVQGTRQHLQKVMQASEEELSPSLRIIFSPVEAAKQSIAPPESVTEISQPLAAEDSTKARVLIG
eukprot:Gb_41023 [translate_table: standard]